MHSRRQLGNSSGLLLILVFIALGGCASGSKIIYDYDHSADFGSYRTYNFMEGAGPNTGDYQSFFTRYMIDAITIEMEKRGYTKSDNPDLLVNFNAVLQDKTNAGIIMLTGKAATGDAAAGLAAGADDYVAKPFEALERNELAARLGWGVFLLAGALVVSWRARS